MTRTTGEPFSLTDLTALAQRQHGVLLTRQATDLGWAPSRINRLLMRDGWTQVRRGSWAQPGLAVDRMVRLRAIQLAHPRLVASHRTAAWLHEIELPWTKNIGKHGVEPRREGVPGLELTTPYKGVGIGRPVAAGPHPPGIVARGSNCAHLRRPCHHSHSHACGPSAVGPPGRGADGGRVRSACLALADRRSGSPAETVARLHIHDAGLHPEPQAHVRTPRGRRLSVDFLFRAEGVAVEIEGYAYHGDRAAHDRDVRRFNELTLCERIRRSLRFTAVDVHCRPDTMIEEIRTALALARGG